MKQEIHYVPSSYARAAELDSVRCTRAVLDKGVVIAGDIKIKLVDIELLSIQIRLVICSVDKAKEMGMDWWVNNPVFCSQAPQAQLEGTLARIDERLARLEAASPKVA